MNTSEMRERLENIANDACEKRAHMVAGMIKPQVLECDADKQCSVIGFPAMEWEINPNGVIHGGIMAAMIDTAIGLTAIGIVGSLTPTINLQISYLRPCPADGMVAVRSYITMLGGSVIHARAEAYDTREPEKLVATAEGAYRRFKDAKPFEWGD